MDDEQYRQARAAIDQPRCCYEKAIQYGYFRCQWQQKIALGERESLHCMQPTAFRDCSEFYALTLRHAAFALGMAKLPQHLSFNQAMKVQIGGLCGMITASGLEPVVRVTGPQHPGYDVSEQLKRLKNKHQDGFESFDFSAVVPQIVHFNARGRTGRGANRKP